MSPADLIADLRRSTRAARARKPDPAPGMTRAQLAARVAELEARCNRAGAKAETLARNLHNHAQEATGDARRLLLALRDDAHTVRALARGEA